MTLTMHIYILGHDYYAALDCSLLLYRANIVSRVHVYSGVALFIPTDMDSARTSSPMASRLSPSR